MYDNKRRLHAGERRGDSFECNHKGDFRDRLRHEIAHPKHLDLLSSMGGGLTDALALRIYTLPSASHPSRLQHPYRGRSHPHQVRLAVEREYTRTSVRIRETELWKAVIGLGCECQKKKKVSLCSDNVKKTCQWGGNTSLEGGCTTAHRRTSLERRKQSYTALISGCPQYTVQWSKNAVATPCTCACRIL